MLEDMKRMVIFAHVVDAGSFTGAARRLGVAKSAISKQVSQLEKNIGVNLLNRSTRSLSLTDIGETYYDYCVRMAEILDDAQAATDTLQDTPRGTLRISCPSSFGIDHVAPLLNTFLQKYPELNAELLLDDNVVDMTEMGIDVAIRVGWLPDSSLRAHKLKDSPRLLCASPEYIERNGLPETPEELMSHDWIIFTLLPTPYHYTFTKNKKSNKIQIKGRIKTNNGNAVRNLVLEGSGVAALADFLVAKDLKEGKLIHLLPDYHIADAGIYAVFQNKHLQQAKVRAFIDFMADRL